MPFLFAISCISLQEADFLKNSGLKNSSDPINVTPLMPYLTHTLMLQWDRVLRPALLAINQKQCLQLQKRSWRRLQKM